MKPLSAKSNGMITIEYAIVIIFLAVPLWYALVGGSGVWNDSDRTSNNGTLTRGPVPSESFPGVLQVIDDRQHDFSDALNQP